MLGNVTQYARPSRRKTNNQIKNIHKNSAASEASNERLYDQVLLPVAPVLCYFPFVGVANCVERYAIFRIEPVRRFSFGMNRILKKCLWKFPGDLLGQQKLSNVLEEMKVDHFEHFKDQY